MRYPAWETDEVNLFVTSTRLRLLYTLLVIPVLWFVDAPFAERVFVVALVTGYIVAAALIEHYGASSDRVPVVSIVGGLGVLVAFAVSVNDSDLRAGALFGYLIV